MIGPSIAAALVARNRWRERRRRDSLRDIAAAQRRQLDALLAQGRRTAWGREHGYASVASPAEYQAATPIGDYHSMAPHWQRYFDGERDVTWPGRPPYFAQTSGTTAGDKYIPVTREMLRSNRRAGLDLFTLYARRGGDRLSKIWRGDSVMLGGSTAMDRRPHGIQVGDLSAIAADTTFWPVSAKLHPRRELALIADWEEKLERVARDLAGRDVRLLTGMPSWVKLLLDRVTEIRGAAPEELLTRVWPNFQLLIHGGVNFEPYRGIFEPFWAGGRRPDFLEVYPASEGFIGIQGDPDDPGLEMMIDHGIFYEFVPLDQWNEEGAPRLLLNEVELNVPYVILLTTCAGLWSYDLGDVVRFTSLNPPKLVINGRHRHFINAFGENVLGEHLERAMTAAQAAVPCAVGEFTAGPAYMSAERPVPCHTYIVEFEQAPDDLGAFARALDAEIRRQSHDYDVKRTNDVGMTVPCIVPVPPGTFYDWMKRRGKLGGQHKVPRCANHRDYLEGLMSLAGSDEKVSTRADRPEPALC